MSIKVQDVLFRVLLLLLRRAAAIHTATKYLGCALKDEVSSRRHFVADRLTLADVYIGRARYLYLRVLACQLTATHIARTTCINLEQSSEAFELGT